LFVWSGIFFRPTKFSSFVRPAAAPARKICGLSGKKAEQMPGKFRPNLRIVDRIWLAVVIIIRL
jgi:hypothetical protein